MGKVFTLPYLLTLTYILSLHMGFLQCVIFLSSFADEGQDKVFVEINK